MITLISAVADETVVADQTPVSIYLPREVTVKTTGLRLGGIGIIRGDSSLSKQIRQIALGKFSSASQTIIVEKAMVLGRLAGEGLDLSRIKLTGADKVKVHRQQKTLEGREIIEAAKKFIKSDPPNGLTGRMQAVRQPERIVVPGDCQDVDLRCRYRKNDSDDVVTVTVEAMTNDRKIARRDIAFRGKYEKPVAVTTGLIKKGELISSENVEIRKELSYSRPDTNFKPPYGQAATRTLAKGTRIEEALAGRPKPEVVVDRNQKVVIRVETAGLLVTAAGQALEKARPGEIIKVRNMDSQRLLQAIVREDGTVKPVF